MTIHDAIDGFQMLWIVVMKVNIAVMEMQQPQNLAIVMQMQYSIKNLGPILVFSYRGWCIAHSLNKMLHLLFMEEPCEGTCSVLFV